MKCPKCGSTAIRKNGHRSGKQNHLCKNCGRQFIESPSPKGYSNDVRQVCLNMYSSGLGFREIERLTGISHNTVINWVRQEESLSSDVEGGAVPEDIDSHSSQTTKVCAIA